MGREKEGYRDMLTYLLNDKGLPMTLTKKQVQDELNISRSFLDKLLRKGLIKESGGKIAIGSVASYLCG